MSKYSRKQAIRIAQLIEEDDYTLTEICHMNHISRKTFYQWKQTKPEFREMLELAEEIRHEKLLHIARTTLKKKLEGYTVKEEKITYIPDPDAPTKLVIKHKVVKTRYCPPDNTVLGQLLEKEEKKQEELLAKEEAERIEAQQAEDNELHIEYNNKQARRTFEFVRTMLKAGIPRHTWHEYTYNPDYMNEDEEEQEQPPQPQQEDREKEETTQKE